MAEFDLVLRGGRVVDGSGSPARTGDVAISDGAIREVGKVAGVGAREIDCDGALITPGFVDLHTHYDGQATWDSQLQPSSSHGVTTVISGNCGVGFAPVNSSGRDRLLRLMEGVEDIPGVALTEGLSWNWESFPQYLDAVAGSHFDIDFATQVPHAALRVFAMGERAEANAAATEAEISEMAAMAKAAIEAGALGFSTSRTIHHKASDGVQTPTYGAAMDELVAIAVAIGETGSGVLQMVSDWDDPEADFALVRGMLTASRRPMSLSLIQPRSAPDRYKEVLAFISECNRDSLPLLGQVASRPIGIILGLQCSWHPFMMNPVWNDLNALGFDDMVRRMAEPAVKAAVLEAQAAGTARHHQAGERVHTWDRMFELGDPPDYEPSTSKSVAALAAVANTTPEEICYDLLLGTDGKGLLYLPFTNYAYGNLDSVHEMLTHPYTVPGLSDGGAHVGTICDASFPTTLLSFWTRDRGYDRLGLEYAVRQQTRDTARAVGLGDRGELRSGLRADVNVIDYDNLGVRKPRLVCDLPAGGKRFLQDASGYVHTFVNGVETYAEGQATGDLPGQLVRGARTR